MNELHDHHALSDDALNDISGGGRSGSGAHSGPQFKVGQQVYFIDPKRTWGGWVRSVTCDENGIWLYALNDENGLSFGSAYEYELQG